MPERALQPFADGIWVQEAFKRFLGFRLRRCMTVVRLTGDRLFVHSPNPPDAEIQRELDALGRVEYLVVPNAVHGHGAREMSEAYPAAKVFGAPGLAARRKRLRIDCVLSYDPEPEWADEVDQALLEGNPLVQEALFLHRRSRTLIVTDLIEHLHWKDLSPWGWVVAGAFGLIGRQTSAPEHSLFLVDPEATERSLTKVRAWDFERIVLAHGQRVDRDGQQVFEQVTSRMLRRARQRPSWLRRVFARLSRAL